MGMDDQRGSLFGSPIHAGALDIFKEDVYGFGVILLELLTGKLVKGNGIDLTDWVQSLYMSLTTVYTDSNRQALG